MGFEPTRAEHNGLAVHRLNHSATLSTHFAMQDIDEGGGAHSRSRSSTSRCTSHLEVPGSLRASASQLGGTSEATSLNDIINNRIEFEHFKVMLSICNAYHQVFKFFCKFFNHRFS